MTQVFTKSLSSDSVVGHFGLGIFQQGRIGAYPLTLRATPSFTAPRDYPNKIPCHGTPTIGGEWGALTTKTKAFTAAAKVTRLLLAKIVHGDVVFLRSQSLQETTPVSGWGLSGSMLMYSSRLPSRSWKKIEAAGIQAITTGSLAGFPSKSLGMIPLFCKRAGAE